MGYILASVAILLPMGVLIATALGVIGTLLLFCTGGIPAVLHGISFTFWNQGISFVFAAVPLFVLMGQILVRSGVGSIFFTSIRTALAGVKGVLAYTVILGSAVFSALNGLSTTNVAAFGTIVTPEIKNTRFDKHLAYGCLVSAGTLGILIPPSVAALIYCGMTEVSVAAVFMAGVIPGITMTLIFLAYVAIRIRINPSLAGIEAEISQKDIRITDRLKSTANLLPAGILIFLTMGSIYLGWATPTEAGAVGAAGAIIFSIVYQRGIKWRILWESCLEATILSTMVMFIIACAQLLSLALSMWGISSKLVILITSLPLPPLGILTLIGIMYLILGCLVDGTSMMVLTLPFLFPVLIALGYDPVWFGAIMIMFIEIGQITPPVGLNLFTLQGVSHEEMKVIWLSAFPFVLLLILGVVIFVIFPDLVVMLSPKIT